MARPRKDIAWPPKLPAGFPLTLTAHGYVARIAHKPRWIAGKVPPAEALRIYHRKAAAILSQSKPIRAPAAPVGAVTMEYILRRWLQDRTADAERGELSLSQFSQNKLSGKRINEIAGHVLAEQWTPDQTREVYDQLAKSFTTGFAKRAVGHLRDACRHAEDQGWVKGVGVGAGLIERLSRRQAKLMQWKLYTPAQIRRILLRLDRKIRIADGRSLPTLVQLRAMVYLALNGGFGAKELSELAKEQVDVAQARMTHRRGKTGALHFVPLWPETVAALLPVLAQRPGDTLLFRTREGNSWCRSEPALKGGRLVRPVNHDNVAWQWNKLVKPLGLKVPGQSFYKLKALNATVADTAGDPHATFALSGHALPGSRGSYVRVDEDRVKRVSDHVRRVLLLDPLPVESPNQGR